MKPSISEKKKNEILTKLKRANTAFQKIYPGDRPERQPVHTVYGGANLFKYNSAQALGQKALQTFQYYAPDFITFGKIFHLNGMEQLIEVAQPIKDQVNIFEALPPKLQKKHPAWLSYQVYHKVLQKLKDEAIEDFRIDFEDGYGNRSNEEEDQTAMAAALEVAKGMKRGSLPPFIGIRIKPFTEEMKERGVRTLDLFLSTLVKKTKGKLPDILW